MSLLLWIRVLPVLVVVGIVVPSSSYAEGEEDTEDLIPVPAPAQPHESRKVPSPAAKRRPSQAAPILHRWLEDGGWTTPTYVYVPTGDGGYVAGGDDNYVVRPGNPTPSSPSSPSYRSDPSYPSHPTKPSYPSYTRGDEPGGEGSGGALSGGAIFGIVLAVVVFLAGAGFVALVCCRLKSVRNQARANREAASAQVAAIATRPAVADEVGKQAGGGDAPESHPASKEQSPVAYVRAPEQGTSKGHDERNIEFAACGNDDGPDDDHDETTVSTLAHDTTASHTVEEETTTEFLPDGSRRIVTTSTTVYPDGSKKIEKTIETQTADATTGDAVE